MGVGVNESQLAEHNAENSSESATKNNSNVDASKNGSESNLAETKPSENTAQLSDTKLANTKLKSENNYSKFSTGETKPQNTT